MAGARRFVRRVLAAWGLGHGETVEGTLSVLVTELATNAVLHARTEYIVTIAYDGGTVRLRVADRSVRLPGTTPHTKEATTGRGLRLVAAYADEWGVDPGDGGKTVWCIIRTGEAPVATPGSPEAAARDAHRRGRATTARRDTRRDGARACTDAPPWAA